jgi:hypothetical protein
MKYPFTSAERIALSLRVTFCSVGMWITFIGTVEGLKKMIRLGKEIMRSDQVYMMEISFRSDVIKATIKLIPDLEAWVKGIAISMVGDRDILFENQILLNL